MRVTSDRQTLILAGETPPQRVGPAIDRLESETSDTDDSESGAQSSQRVTIISARVDAIVTQGLYSPNLTAPAASAATDAFQNLVIAAGSSQIASVANPSPSVPALAPRLHQAYVVSTRGSSSSAANAYARTRDYSDTTRLIDTYA